MESWLDAVEEAGGNTDAYRPLRRTLSELLPTNARFGVGYQNGVPVVLAVVDDWLFCLRAGSPASQDRDLSVQTVSIPLTAHHRVEVASYLEQSQRGAQQVRSWTLSGLWANSFHVLTREPYRTSFMVNRCGNLIMSDAVRQLGWQLPD